MPVRLRRRTEELLPDEAHLLKTLEDVGPDGYPYGRRIRLKSGSALKTNPGPAPSDDEIRLVQFIDVDVLEAEHIAAVLEDDIIAIDRHMGEDEIGIAADAFPIR